MVEDANDAAYAPTPLEETANARQRALFAKTPQQLMAMLKKAGASPKAGLAKAQYVSMIMRLEAEVAMEASIELEEVAEAQKGLSEEDLDRRLAPLGQMIKLLEDTVATLVAQNASMAVRIDALEKKDDAFETKIGSLGSIEALGSVNDLKHPSIPGLTG